MKILRNSLPILFSMVFGVAPVLGAPLALDNTLPQYQKVNNIVGNLFTMGTPDIMDLMTLWGIQFRRNYANARVYNQAADVPTGMSKFVDGKVQLLFMTRLMNREEQAVFYQQQGYNPSAVRVAFDMLAVFVHRENPLEKLTLQQLSAIYSAPGDCVNKAGISQWGALGLEDSWQAQPIEIYARNTTTTGGDDYFTQQVLCAGEFSPRVKKQDSDGDMLHTVTGSMAAIGYSGMTSLTAAVKVLPIAARSGRKAIQPTAKNAITGRYPLTQAIYIYVHKQPNKLLPALVREFLKLVLSYSGQSLVAQYGYVPLSGSMAKSAQLFINR